MANMDNANSTQSIMLKSQENGAVIPAAPPAWGPQMVINGEEEELNLRQIWSVIRHRRRLIVGVMAATIAAAGLYTWSKTPIYEGKFQLLVGEPISEANNVDNLILQQWITSDADYDTQIEVLQSTSLLLPLLEKIQQKYPDVEDKDFIDSEKPPLKLEQLEDTKIIEVSFRDEDPAKIQYILDLVAEGYLKYSLDERKTEVTHGLDFVKEQLPGLRKQVNDRQAQMQKFRQRYDLLDPEEYAKELSQQLFELEKKYIDTQLEIKDATSEYSLLQQQVGLDPEQAIVASYLGESPRYQNLLNQLQAVEIDLAKESALFRPNSPTIQLLQEKRANLLPLLQEEAQKILGSRFGSIGNSPSLAASSSPSSYSSLRQELNKQLVAAANKIQVQQVRSLVLERELANVQQEIKQMPRLARQYTDLQRELKVANDSLARFLEAEQNLQLESAQQNLPWQVISDPRVGEDPVSPRPVRNLVLGTIAGLLLGLGAAFLFERLDPVFHSFEELKEETKLPILGVIPLQKDLGTLEKALKTSLPKIQIGTAKLVAKTFGGEEARGGYYQSSGFLEAFRSLNTNIRLLGSDSSLTSFAITSAAPAEGKSTVSLNLAKAAAAMGQRVLVVDADLRRPQLHERYGLPNDQGLSNVLATGLALEEAIQPISEEENENLWVLTAGEVPPDPTRLLSSERMRQVQAQLEAAGNFDLVIYDTPPMLNFADARILGPLTAGIILVARISKTDRSALRQAIDELKLSQVPLLGLVANATSRKRSGSYYYYSRYYKSRGKK